MIPKLSHTMPLGTWSSRFSVHIENSDRAIRDQTMITSGTRKTIMRRESEAMLKNLASEGPASLAANVHTSMAQMGAGVPKSL